MPHERAGIETTKHCVSRAFMMAAPDIPSKFRSLLDESVMTGGWPFCESLESDRRFNG